MRYVTASLFLAGCLAAPLIASQTGGGATAGQRVRACEILTRELALKVSTADGKGAVEKGRTFEDELGPESPSCKRGRIFLVLNPFKNPAQYRKTLGKDWTPVPGIGGGPLSGRQHLRRPICLQRRPHVRDSDQRRS